MDKNGFYRWFRDPFSALSHLAGAVAALPGGWLLLKHGGDTPMRIAALVIYTLCLVGLFSASGIYHTVIASPAVIQILRKMDHSAIYLLIAGTYTPFCLIAFQGFWRWGLLAGLSLAGGLIALGGLWAFQRVHTTFNPLHPERASALVEQGVYRFTRNPMYLGMALVLLGWACWLAHPLAFACIPLALAYLQRFQIRPEERVLRAHFGAAYEAYSRRVRRWL